MRDTDHRRAIETRCKRCSSFIVAAVATIMAGFGHVNTGIAAGASAPAISVPAADASVGAGDGSAQTAVTAAPGVFTLAAGRIPGEFAVSQSGAATYRIPVWTPPGVGAVDLQLALVYNSRVGSGTLGAGWTLSGLSAISRCNRTVDQDGYASGVSNNGADRYCLDGMQLKLVSGTYGVAGSVYSTEIEAFSRITASGTIGNGPASFTLTTKNGLVYDYGTTADARIHAGSSGPVRTWALSRIRDRSAGGAGNSIAVTYANDAQATAYTNGTFRVSSISYPTTATGQGPFYTVAFAYASRPATDIPSGYLTGNRVREPNQLQTITIQAIGASAPIKTYYLGYGTAPVSGRLRLTSLQECAPASCLRPTTIQYQDGVAGWAATARNTAVVVSASKSLVPLDLNADGLTDILYPVTLSNGTLSWRILLATSTGFAQPMETGFVTTASESVIPGQFSGNGRTQFLIPRAGYWYVAGWETSGFVAVSTGLAVGGETGAADFDGDGLDDLMLRLDTAPPSIAIRRNLTTPSAATKAAFGATSETIWTVPNLRQAMPASHLRVADLNGDGRADIVALSYTTAERSARLFATPLLSNGFGAAFTIGNESQLALDSMTALGDWNADGCTDVFQVQQIFVSNCAGSLSPIPTGAIPAGGGGLYAVLPTDWNGDGRVDLMYVDSATKQWHVAASLGEAAAVPTTAGINAPNSTAWFVFDADGDGMTDLGYRDGNEGNKLKYQLRVAPGLPGDLAVRFTDGFGMQQSPSYVSIARSNYTRSSDATFPEVDFQAPLYVVDQFSATDGTGGTYQNQFHYYGARLHIRGRGFEGFESQRIVDTRSGHITIDTAHRQYPYTGMHIQRSVYQADATTKLGTWSATLASQQLGSASERRWFPYAQATTERVYEAGGNLNGTLVTETGTTFTYGDGYGNPTQVQKTTTDKDPYSPFFNNAWQSTVTSTFANDIAAWCIGLPSSSVTTAQAPGQVAASRKRSYASDPATCRITQQTLEPNTAALKVSTTFDFDGCGNVSSVRIVGSSPAGAALPARTTTFGYGTRCQMLESATSPLGATTTYANNYDFGVPRQATDPNGLSTAWLQDEFGRRVQETRPDQTKTAWGFESCSAGPCWGVGDLRFTTYETHIAADGGVTRSLQFFYDGNERLRYREYHRALGTWTNEVFAYDSLGRLSNEYRPYSAAFNGYTSRSYDAHDRLITKRDLDAGGAVRSATTVAYAGRTSGITDALGRTRTYVADVAGLVRKVIDPASGGAIEYAYDSFGNLARVQDAIGAVSTGLYNARGFRTQWSDADAGAWTYTPNSLNELVAWSDAKGQSFSATYDLAGRMTSRTEPEGTSTWTWGASPASKNVGRLRSMSGYGYTETLSYDAYGRLSRRAITTDQPYQYDYTYNAQGFIDTVAYPSSPIPNGQTAGRFKLRYGYGFGANTSIEDITEAQPRTLWSLTAANDYSAATAESLAAGTVTLSASYDAATNQLTALQASSGGVAGNRQNVAYQWDAVGNLLQRRDVSRNLLETFAVDALDRVTSSALNGASNLSVSYDAAGDVTHKSDVGAYVYADASHPHAVTSAGADTFAYDRNGNLSLRNGVIQKWASYNLPTSVKKAGFQSQFAYGPDHRRWRQVATYQNGTETTHYVGGLLEKERTTSTGVTYWRHYVATPSGLGIVVSRNSDATASTSYVLTDHLGSTEAVLNDTGAPVSRQSFSAFGTRRGDDWKSNTAPDWLGIANTSRRGYTSHEMLDNVGLVHMNGRVYDPQLGRFLSVDPVVADLRDSQSVNAYAYVGNRPLIATDPTGEFVQGIPYAGAVFVSIAQSIFSFSSHDSRPPPPSATALPGQSAQNGVSMCGPGTFSPTCGGAILYAGVPRRESSGLGTSTWGATSLEEDYGAENVEQLFIDLWANSVDVLVLSPVHDAQVAWDAAHRGEYLEATLMAGLSICGVLKPCGGIAKGAKAIKGVKRSATAASDVTVLGHYPEYVRLGEHLAARRFNVPMSAWEKMSPVQQWEANRKFLDRAISRGGHFVLATPAAAARAGSHFSRELEYLLRRGYKLTSDLN